MTCQVGSLNIIGATSTKESSSLKDWLRLGKNAAKYGAPAATILIGFFLWLYLQEIGRSELFSNTVMTIQGFVGLAMIATLTILAFTYYFNLPSVIIILINETFLKGKEPLKNSIRIIITLQTVALGMFTIAILGDFIKKEHLTIVLIIAIVCFSVLILDYLIRKNPDLLSEMPNILSKVFALICIGFLLFVISVLPIFSASYILEHFIFRGSDSAWWMILVAIFSMAGSLPGLLYLFLPERSRAPSMMLVTAFVAVICALLFGWKGLSAATLQNMGVVSLNEKSFQLVNSSLSPSISQIFENNESFFKAHIRYNYADILLLCKSKYIPFSGSASNDCVAFRQEDVRYSSPVIKD